jgi:hypothetical protein
MGSRAGGFRRGFQGCRHRHEIGTGGSGWAYDGPNAPCLASWLGLELSLIIAWSARHGSGMAANSVTREVDCRPIVARVLLIGPLLPALRRKHGIVALY